MKKYKKSKVGDGVKIHSGITFRNLENGKRFISFNFNFIDNEKLFDTWEDVIKKQDVKDCFVSVNTYIKEEDIGKLDIDKMSKLLQKAFYVKPLTNHIRGYMSPKNKNDDSIISFKIKPLEAVEHYIKMRKPSNKESILKIANKILNGHDIDFTDLENPKFTEWECENESKLVVGKKVRRVKK